MSAAKVAPGEYADLALCEASHDDGPRVAVALIHLVESTSAANVTALCANCLLAYLDDWITRVQGHEPDCWIEIRPVTQPDLCPGHTDAPGPHHHPDCHYHEESP